MRYLIYGAGAIGGVMGARLFQSGRDVLLIARGAHYDAIKSTGLTLRAPDGEETLPIPVAAHPREIQFRDDDVVVLAMKTQDTSAALDDLIDANAGELPVVCAQNGVENERLALRRVPHVYGMMVNVPATHLEPGVVQVHVGPRSGALTVGRYPQGIDTLTETLAADFAASTFAISTDDNVMRWKYAKVLPTLSNVLEAAFMSQDASRVREALEAEAQACYAAAGIASVTHVEMREALNSALFGQGPMTPRPGASSWQSLARGLTMETDYLNGEIVLLGRLHGVDVPVNEAAVQLARRLVQEQATPGSVDLAAFERSLGLS